MFWADVRCYIVLHYYIIIHTHILYITIIISYYILYYTLPSLPIFWSIFSSSLLPNHSCPSQSSSVSPPISSHSSHSFILYVSVLPYVYLYSRLIQQSVPLPNLSSSPSLTLILSNIHSIRVGSSISLFIFSSDLSSLSHLIYLLSSSNHLIQSIRVGTYLQLLIFYQYPTIQE